MEHEVAIVVLVAAGALVLALACGNFNQARFFMATQPDKEMANIHTGVGFFFLAVAIVCFGWAAYLFP